MIITLLCGIYIMRRLPGVVLPRLGHQTAHSDWLLVRDVRDAAAVLKLQHVQSQLQTKKTQKKHKDSALSGYLLALADSGGMTVMAAGVHVHVCIRRCYTLTSRASLTTSRDHVTDGRCSGPSCKV